MSFFPRTSAQLNSSESVHLTKMVRSIDRVAERCANGLTSTLTQAKAWLVDHEELKRRYKEKWKTWDAACEQVYGITRQAIHKKMTQISEDVLSTTVDEGPYSTKKEQSENLNIVAKLPDPLKPEPKEEEPEPPRVKSADEKPREEPKKEVAPVDTTDHKIPKALLPTWEARVEIQALITAASELRCAVEECQKKNPRLFTSRYWDKHHQMQNLDSVHHQLTQIKPDVVCPECDGSLKDDHGRECKVCALTGFISKQRWHHDYEKSNTSFIKAKVASRNGG